MVPSSEVEDKDRYRELLHWDTYRLHRPPKSVSKVRQRSRRMYISTYPCSITSTQVEDVLHRGLIDWTAEQRVLLLRLQDDE